MMPKIGNNEVTNIPAFKPICSVVKWSVGLKFAASWLAETLSMIIPINCGAIAAPKSPPAAINAYAPTPGEGIFSSIIINEPGHSMDVKIPVNTHAIKAGITPGTNPTIK